MGKYNLVTIRPKGFLHSSAFAEVKDSLGWALAALGHQTMATENAYSCSPDSVNVIFGAELLAPTAEIPPNSILYNLEQPSHPRMEGVRRHARGRVVWDYSEHNNKEWEKSGISARHVPIGYTPNLTRIPVLAEAEKDIDVFFAGWMTPRRSHLIQELTKAGLKVVATDSCYGGGRDQLISRAKICLNVNHDGRTQFNVVRASYLWANRKLVLSETSDHCESWQVKACAWAEYDHLVESCQNLLQDPALRESQANEGYAQFRQHDYIETVAQAFEEDSASLILARYQKGCREGDMKDFLPVLRSLAKGKVLEIGVRDGASTSALLLGLEEHGGELISVDIQDCSQLWQHRQWQFRQADSKTLTFPRGHFDLILIDGDHTLEGFRKDLEHALDWVKPGGLVLCHDISPLPNYTQEARGGDWPSEFVGEEFFRQVREKRLRYFLCPGAWGMGVILADPC